MTGLLDIEQRSSENGLLFWTDSDHYAQLKDRVIGTGMMATSFYKSQTSQ